jgi:outer membrane protein assembly factor BamE
LLLSSCAIYKIDVQQGNLITQEMLDQLYVGIPAKKARFILGTPLLVDTFHPKRWDYLYSFQAGGDKREQRRITLFFDESDSLARIDGDVRIGSRPMPKTTPVEDKDQQQPIL